MSRLKKSWIVVANVALMAAILVFVALYSNHEKNENYEHQVEHFVNKTVAMERVTENYLEGEQSICNNWAHYINSSDMTLEEAAAYVRATHAQTTVSGHLIDAETLQGYSSRPRPNTEDDYSVSYQRIELLGDGSWIADIGTAINISRTYTNPVNGEQSLAFCNRITARDGETGEKRPAYLLRVVPTSNLAEKWVFPQKEYENEEFSMIAGPSRTPASLNITSPITSRVWRPSRSSSRRSGPAPVRSSCWTPGAGSGSSPIRPSPPPGAGCC